MIDTIELLIRQSSIWKFTHNNVSDIHFRLGFLYGGMFILNRIPSTSDPRFVVYDHHNTLLTEYYTIIDMDNTGYIYTSNMNIPLYEIKAATKDELYEIEGYNQDHPDYNPYVVSLLDPFDESKAVLFTTESSTFFQGLFTALNAVQIPYEKVVLHKPIRAEISYNILGLNLPLLEDL